MFDAEPYPGEVAPLQIDVDAAGDLYVAGYCTGVVDFDPLAGEARADCGAQNSAFVVKLDGDGSVLWLQVWGEAPNTLPYNAALTSDGALLLAGFYDGATDLDPGAGVDERSSAGQYDAFIMRLSAADGSYLGARTFGGEGQDMIYSGGVSEGGHQLFAGNYTGTTDFDPGAGEAFMTAATDWSSFAVGFGPDDAFSWAEEGGASVRGVDGGSGSLLFATGSFAGTADLGLGAATDERAPVGPQDLVVWRVDAGE
jgi:hypothetical protein